MGRMGKPQKQNQQLLEDVRNFKEHDDQNAFDNVARTLHGYIRHLAVDKFFYVAGHSSDDVYQEGLYALATKAIPDYCEDKGPFLSFAKLCIRRHIITVLKSANNNRNGPLNTAMSMDAPACKNDDGTPVSINAFISESSICGKKDHNVMQEMIASESHANLKALLKGKLTPLESVVLDYYLMDMSYVDIARAMNKTRRGRRRVNPKVIDNALCRIKKKALEIEEDENETLSLDEA